MKHMEKQIWHNTLYRGKLSVNANSLHAFKTDMDELLKGTFKINFEC